MCEYVSKSWILSYWYVDTIPTFNYYLPNKYLYETGRPLQISNHCQFVSSWTLYHGSGAWLFEAFGKESLDLLRRCFCLKCTLFPCDRCVMGHTSPCFLAIVVLWVICLPLNVQVMGSTCEEC